MTTPKLGMLVAATMRGEIGVDNTLPWKLTGDLRRFSLISANQVVIMGRNTFVSLGCKPLPNRINIVVSTMLPEYTGQANLRIAHSIEAAVELAKTYNTDWIYFIGGAGIYEYALGVVDVVEWTVVHDRIDRDHLVYDTQINGFHFPKEQWKCTRAIDGPDVCCAGTTIPLPSHTWVTLERI